MSEQENTQVQAEDVEFAVLIYKMKDGNLGIQNVDSLPPMKNPDELYQVLTLLVRNMESEHTAAALMRHMMQVQQQVQAAQEGRTESGIVLPT